MATAKKTMFKKGDTVQILTKEGRYGHSFKKDDYAVVADVWKEDLTVFIGDKIQIIPKEEARLIKDVKEAFFVQGPTPKVKITKASAKSKAEIKTHVQKGYVFQLAGTDDGDAILNIFGNKIDIRIAIYNALVRSEQFRDYILDSVEYYVSTHKED